MWTIEINFQGKWTCVADGFETQSGAEWAAARWKQQNGTTGDPFRYKEVGPQQCLNCTAWNPTGDCPDCPYKHNLHRQEELLQQFTNIGK
jgi:hypothetical protein